MTWPPVKAWTSKAYIKNQRHFVAINYGGEFTERWVVLMSVLDSSLVVKVPWAQLVDPSIWEYGWDENNQSDSSLIVNSKCGIGTDKFTSLSVDSGLTIPITKDLIRPWFLSI